MNYLKPYHIFESGDNNVNIKLDIKDIILELDDHYGIKYYVKDIEYLKSNQFYDCVRLGIEAVDRKFKLEDIMDVLLRLHEYTKENGWTIEMKLFDVSEYCPIDEFIGYYKGIELNHIYIFIRNIIPKRKLK